MRSKEEVMGCNIHLHTEVKIDGMWRHWGSPSVGRNYLLFEKMAGVRGDVEKAISPPKGMPNDATFETQYDYAWWGTDAHTPSYLTAKEIAGLCEWRREQWAKHKYASEWAHPWLQFGYLFGGDWGSLVEHPESMDKRVTDVRWIFWFDN